MKILRWQGIGDFDEIPDRNKCDHYEISLATYRDQPMAVGSKEDKCAEVYDFKAGKWTNAPSYEFQDGSRSHLGKLYIELLTLSGHKKIRIHKMYTLSHLTAKSEVEILRILSICNGAHRVEDFLYWWNV